MLFMTRNLVALLSAFAVATALPVSSDEVKGQFDHSSLKSLLEMQQPLTNQRLESGSEDTPGRQYWNYLIDSLPAIKHYLKSLDECIQIVKDLQIVQEPSYDMEGEDYEEVEAYQVSLCQLAVTLAERWGTDDLDIEDLADMLGQQPAEHEVMNPYKTATKDDQIFENSKRSYDSIGLGPFGLKGAHSTGRNSVKKVYDSIGLGPFGLKRSYDSIGLGPMGLKRSYDSIGNGPWGLKSKSAQQDSTEELNQNDLTALRNQLVEEIAKQLANKDERNEGIARD